MKNPESFTITLSHKDGSKSVSTHITADIVKSWEEKTHESSRQNEEYFRSQILCTPIVAIDENGKERTLWQNSDGSWT